MISAKDYINKIKWSPGENSTEYSIGYWDNIEKKIIFIDFNEIKTVVGNFLSLDRAKETYIPMHRIREIRKKGKVVWKRTTA
ncbi:MAG TPA: DUF504 domain-containing protein [Candidatus Nanoarchaeia archaeon]|nr:DUF504 domain-containing protein [Candidatus Nanoarchaeia archaeon]